MMNSLTYLTLYTLFCISCHFYFNTFILQIYLKLSIIIIFIYITVLLMFI